MGFYLLCFVCNVILICCGFRGLGRCKKNFDIFFELFNNFFKYFKVDYYVDRFVNLLNGELMKIDDVNKLILCDLFLNVGVSVMFEGVCDVNNNVMGVEWKDL